MPGDRKFASQNRLGGGPGKGVQGAAALGMGKEQELLEAARTGHLPAVEKLLSGKRLSSGFGGGGSGGSGGGSGGGGGGGGLGSSSHPLSSLLRWVSLRGWAAAWRPPFPCLSPGSPERSGLQRPWRGGFAGCPGARAGGPRGEGRQCGSARRQALLVSPNPAAKNGGSAQVAASAAWHSRASPSPAVGCQLLYLTSHFRAENMYILNLPHLLQKLPRLAESRGSPGGNSLDSLLLGTWNLPPGSSGRGFCCLYSNCLWVYHAQSVLL